MDEDSKAHRKSWLVELPGSETLVPQRPALILKWDVLSTYDAYCMENIVIEQYAILGILLALLVKHM